SWLLPLLPRDFQRSSRIDAGGPSPAPHTVLSTDPPAFRCDPQSVPAKWWCGLGSRESLHTCPPPVSSGTDPTRQDRVPEVAPSAPENHYRISAPHIPRELFPILDKRGNQFSASWAGFSDWRPPSSNRPTADCSGVPQAFTSSKIT